jgi:hypothetical protein
MIPKSNFRTKLENFYRSLPVLKEFYKITEIIRDHSATLSLLTQITTTHQTILEQFVRAMNGTASPQTSTVTPVVKIETDKLN